MAISISEGRLSSATLMRRLRSNSRKNRIYKVFREVGRSVRTVALLRYLADPQLRARITAATNKVESYNGFAHWLAFGNNGVLADNDPAEQEKLIKLNTLLANLVIFHNALDIMDVVRGAGRRGLAHHRRPARRDVAVPARPHQPVRRLRHRRARADPRRLRRPPGRRPGRRILSSPDPAPSFRNRPWRVLGLSWLHPSTGRSSRRPDLQAALRGVVLVEPVVSAI